MHIDLTIGRKYILGVRFHGDNISLLGSYDLVRIDPVCGNLFILPYKIKEMSLLYKNEN